MSGKKKGKEDSIISHGAVKISPVAARGPAARHRRIGDQRKSLSKSHKELSAEQHVSISGTSSCVGTTSDSDNLREKAGDILCNDSLVNRHVCLEEEDTFSDTSIGELEEGESSETSVTAQDSCSSDGRATKTRRKRGHSRLSYKGKCKSSTRLKTTSASEGNSMAGPSRSGEEMFEQEVEIVELDKVSEKESKHSNRHDVTVGGKDSTAPQEGFTQLISNLKLLLPRTWIVNGFIFKECPAVRLMHLNESLNADVEKCIYWMAGKIGIFVRHFPVPSENKYVRTPPPEDGNIGAISQHLAALVEKVSSAKVCTGINEYEEHWDNCKQGSLDKTLNDGPPCFRSKFCQLLLSESSNLTVCPACASTEKMFERNAAREAKEREEKEKAREGKGGEKLVNVNDKYLSKEELIEKKNIYKKKSFFHERKARRLDKRVKNLVVKLDQLLHDELIGSLIRNKSKMTPLQRKFYQSQFDAFQHPDKRGLRWHPMMVRIALALEANPETIRQFVQLPTKRTLYDYTHYLDAKEGCRPEVLKEFKDKIDKEGSEDHHSYVNVMFDEMHIRSGLVTLRSTGEVIGYTKLTEVEMELQALEDQLKDKIYKPQLAKKILVYYLHTVTGNVEGVVAVHSSDNLTAAQVYTRSWDVIYNLEEADIKVICLTFDGAAVNRKFVTMHVAYDSGKDFVYVTRNLASGEERPLFFIVDPPHLLKTVRNNLANSFCHKKTRKLWKNNEFLSWKVIESVHAVTKMDSYRRHKLTLAHVKLTSFSCMKVNYAAQVCSESVAKVIEDLSNHEALKLYDTCELVKLLRLMNKFFDCVNAKANSTSGKSALEAYKKSDDDRLKFLREEFLGFFNDWKVDVLQRPGYYTDKQRSRFIISHQSLEALEITVHSITGVICYMLDQVGAPSIDARVLSQDRLEQFFSSVRRHQGDNRQPTLKGSLDSIDSLRVQGQAAQCFSRKGNTEVEKRNIELDDTPLPKRKKARKDPE